MENNNAISHLRSQIREHKHNYSEDFGLIVRLPAQRLFRELLTNPELFSDEEYRLIIEIYTSSTKIVAKQEQLGYTLDEQLNELKTKSLPKIKEIIESYNVILKNHLELPNRSLITVLQSAIRDSNMLCSKLQNIENEDYGKSEPFLLRTAILRKFQRENSQYGVDGQQSMEIETSFAEYNDAKVDMNEEGFITHVIGNIIKNLHEHAFKITMEHSEKENTYLRHPKKGLFSTLYNRCINSPIIRRLTYIFKKEHASPNSQNIISENKVKIIFEQDKDNTDRINILIENNGVPFTGDYLKVFELGIGEGDGEHIGLYSAKKFLEFYGATIAMYKPYYKEYSVGIKINLKLA